MKEQAIIEGCLQKDPLAQRELFNRYSPKMLGVCNRFASCREDAEDMLQEGFIKIFAQIHTFEGKGAFEGWIRRIIVHTCINFLKRYKKFSDNIKLEHAEDLHYEEESFSSIMQGRQVMETLGKLPFGYRTVLNLYAIEGYSHKEIGEMLEVGESTSRSQYTRAKGMLKNMLVKNEIIESPKPISKWLAAFGSR